MRITIFTPAIVALLLGANEAHAAFTTESCLAQKLQAAGKFQKCRAGEAAKLLQSKPAAVAKCTTTFQDKLAKLSAKASKAGIGCRYGDNGDGTVTDYDTGLQWEQKNGAGGGSNFANPHDVDNDYSWHAGSGATPSGTAFTDFLGDLNTCTTGGTGFQLAGFANHCDWRLPTLEELQTIVDATQGTCGGGSGPCIDPIFGPLVPGGYWSATTDAITPGGGDAWGVAFNNGSSYFAGKGTSFLVRAVRGGL